VRTKSRADTRAAFLSVNRYMDRSSPERCLCGPPVALRVVDQTEIRPEYHCIRNTYLPTVKEEYQRHFQELDDPQYDHLQGTANGK